MQRRSFLSLGAAALASGAQSLPARDRTVILISIDGLPAFSWNDPDVPVPFLRRMAREGAAAEGMTPVNPSVTWPNHASMVTGVPPARHGLLMNGMPVFPGDRKPPVVEPWRDKEEMVLAPTVYDLAHQAGLTTAEVDWVAIYRAKTIHWAFPERPDPEGPVEKEMIAAGLITPAAIERFFRVGPAVRDHYWTEAAIHILRRHRPNLLLFHLLNTDALNHRYGIRTWASDAAFAYADACVRRLFEALDQERLQDRATFLIVSDHGFRNVTRTIRANALLRQIGLRTGEGSAIECDAHVIPEGGTALAYVRNPARRREILSQMREAFGKLEGVAQVIDASGFPGLGLPSPEAMPRMGDLLLAAADGYAFGNGETAPVVAPVEGDPRGSHGYLSTDPEMRAAFLAWGRGIRRGARLGTIRNLDVAPTVAALLGLEMKNIEGRPLTGILS